MTSAYLTALMAVFLAVRVVPRRIFSHGEGYLCSDKWVHLYYAKLYRDNGYRWISQWPRTDIQGPVRSYPPLFHWLISFIGQETLLRNEQYVTTAIQLATCAMIAAFACTFTSRFGLGDPLVFTVLTGAAYCFLPILFGPNSGMVFCTARPFGAFFSNLFLVSLALFSMSHSAISAACCVLAFFLAAVSSRFAVQTNVFISCVFVLIRGDLMALGLAAASAAVTLTAGYGVYRPVLKNHIRHLVVYKKIFMTGIEDMLEKHSSFLRAIGRSFDSFRKEGFLGIVREFYNAPAMRIALMNPLTIFSLAGGAFLYGSLPESVRVLYTLLVSGMVVTLLTATPWLKYLGDAERYLEFGCLFPTCFISVYLALQLGLMVPWAAILAYSIVFAFFSFRFHPRVNPGRQEELFTFLATVEGKKVITFPTSFYPMILLSSNVRIPYMEGWQMMEPYYNPKDFSSLKKRWDHLYGIFPGPNMETLDEQTKEFGIDLIIYCRQETPMAKREKIEAFLGGYPLVYDNGDYRVYQALRVGGAQ